MNTTAPSTELKTVHRVAVYGTLRRGCSNFRVMERANGKFIKHTVAHGLAMYVSPGWGFPFAKIQDGANTTVEIFEVDNEGLAELDRLEGYRPSRPASQNMYLRVQCPSLDGVEVYVYNRTMDRSCEHIEHGNWVTYLASR